VELSEVAGGKQRNQHCTRSDGGGLPKVARVEDSHVKDQTIGDG
jgi:hypothetical protein